MKNSKRTCCVVDKIDTSKIDKTIELVSEPTDKEDPKKVTLVLPYRDGKIALIDDLENINIDNYVKKEELNIVDNKINNLANNVVTINDNQIIHSIKVFNNTPRSNQPAKEDDELVRLDQIKELLNKNTEFTYTNPEKMAETIGGIEAGTSFDNVPLKELLDTLLYPYREPVVDNMSLTKYEHPCYSFLPNINMSYSISNEKNVKPKSVSIFVNKREYLISQPTKGTVSINNPLGLNYFSTNVTTLPVEVRCMSIKDKDVNRSIGLQFTLWCWYGCCDNPDITQLPDPLTTMNNSNFVIKYTNNLKQQFNFPQGGYKYIIFPNTWSNPVKFIDVATQFEVPMNYMGDIVFDFSPDGNDGVNPISRLTYKVYRSHNILGGSVNVKIN